MRQGFRVIDSDTHVNPSLDVLLRYADDDLRDHMDELKPYTRTVKPRPGQGDAEDLEAYTLLSIKPLRLQRVAGEKPRPVTERAATAGFCPDAPRWSRDSRSRPASPRTTRAAVCKIWIPRAGTSTSSSPGRGPMALPRWPRTWPRASCVRTTGIWLTTARRMPGA